MQHLRPVAACPGESRPIPARQRSVAVQETKPFCQRPPGPPATAAKHSPRPCAELTDATPVRGELPVLPLRRASSLNRYPAERVSIIAVLHTAVGTSISSRSGHSHAMPNSRSALCARSSCTCKMVWPERRAGVKPSLKCFVRITSMLAVQWHATKRAFCATVLFIHHCDASTHRRLQSYGETACTVRPLARNPS